VDCNTENKGCKGGWISSAFLYTKEQGIELEQEYPHKYLKRQGKCYHNSTRVAFKNTAFYEAHSITNQNLKRLVAHQPVGVAMHSPTSILQHYK